MGLKRPLVSVVESALVTTFSYAEVPFRAPDRVTRGR
jgi:hypothetical protein